MSQTEGKTDKLTRVTPSAEQTAFEPVVPDVRLDIYRGEEWITAFAGDVKTGLGKAPRTLPSKYFYDARGSELFDQITELPEYYPTRAEAEILRASGADIIEAAGACDLVELGSGSSVKTDLLLQPLLERNEEVCYMPIDVSESAVRAAAVRLVDEYPGLRVHAMIGDFERHLGGLPDGHRRLFAFLGGTIGNFTPDRMMFFLRRISGLFNEGDRMLIGLDLVKEVEVLEDAYNDAAGITADFNKNVLATINDNLRGNFNLDHFEHVAFFDRENSWIEMRLRSRADQQVRIGALDLELGFSAGDEIRTEISRKFRKRQFEREAIASGLVLEEWFTDSQERFALALLAPGG